MNLSQPESAEHALSCKSSRLETDQSMTRSRARIKSPTVVQSFSELSPLFGRRSKREIPTFSSVFHPAGSSASGRTDALDVRLSPAPIRCPMCAWSANVTAVMWEVAPMAARSLTAPRAAPF